MEQKRNFKGLKKYESLLKTVCMVDDYYNLTEEEWEGCLGVACIISIVEGVVPNLSILAKHLDIPYYNPNLQNAFERLKISGIFSEKRNIKNDPLLKGNGIDKYLRTAAEEERGAWCHIAGTASGLIGLGKTLKSESKSV